MRETLNFDHGWLFHLGDIESPLPNTHIAAYMNHKAGWSRGAARVNYDDSDWRNLDLPHDWSVEGKFDPANHLSAGFLPRGIAWYRRHFALAEADRGRRITITFDGVATHCTVYVNGHLLQRNFCGYTPFTVDISDVAQFGEQLNVVAVRVDATYMEGWWYEGAGIYRHVWLTKTDLIHIPENGVWANAHRCDDATWRVQVATTVAHSGLLESNFDVVTELFDPQQRQIVRKCVEATWVEPRGLRTFNEEFEISDPELWSLLSPNLYTARVTLRLGKDEILDRSGTTFGFRTIRFDADRGFFLNDQPVKLLGTCNHQDHAGLGVALPDSIHEFRIRKLKEMGCNAYRAAHHPPAKELLDACDRLGMLVMDENRAFGSSPEHLSQLRSMVLRDRNHPSVILWSICNEESIQTSPVSKQIAETMVAEVKRLDPTRPVTAAVSGGVLNDGCIGDALDVMCINYQLPTYDAYHEKFPHKPLIAGETHCVVSTRGIYRTDESQCHLAADDSEKHPWGETARETWRHIVARPHVAGLFVWTGFDYRGEPKPVNWPCVNSQMGFLDACGFEKDSFYLHQAWWTREPMAHILGHWNRTAGEQATVKVYTNCEEVELLLNGRSLGRKTVDAIEMACWQVDYEPGKLVAVAYRNGAAATEHAVETAGEVAALQLVNFAERYSGPPGLPMPEQAAAGGEAVPIAVRAVDDKGRFVPHASMLVSFEISGPGHIIGVGNGDPKSHEPDKARSRRLFNGLAQVIVQGTGAAGEIVLTAHSAEVASARLVIPVSPTPQSAAVPTAAKRHLLTDWRVSPLTADRPDPNQTIAAADMNSWERVTVGPRGAPAVRQAGYVIFRTTFTPPKSMQSTGGRIVLAALRGEVQVFVAGQLTGQWADAHTAGRVVATFPATAEKLTISILARTEQPGEVIAGPIELLPNL